MFTYSFIDKVLNALCYVFCFVVIVDPPNTILKVKNLVFCVLALLLVLRYRRILMNAGGAVILVYFILIGTFLRGVIVGYTYDYDASMMFLKAFTPLFLLCWVDKIYWLNKLLLPSLIISIITLFIVFSMYYMPELEGMIYGYMRTHDDFILMSHRSFLGYDFIAVFYRSIPLVIIPYSLYCYKFFFEEKNHKKNLVVLFLLGLSLYFSGTRANMLAALGVVAILFIYRIYRSNFSIVAYLLSFLSICSFLCILFMLLSEKGESSNEIKFSHLISYINLFSNNVDVLFCGQGVGSYFYSLGFKMMTTQTEWSYLELIRYVGLLGAVLIIGLYVFPIYKLYKKRRELTYALPISIGYILFLCIAGTNPLLINSTGMLALLTTYSYSLSQIRNDC